MTTGTLAGAEHTLLQGHATWQVIVIHTNCSVKTHMLYWGMLISLNKSTHK